MSLWSNTDANTSVPKFAPQYVNLHTTQNNSNLLYGNTTTSAFITGANVGVFAVDTTEQRVSETKAGGPHPQHAGWVIVRAGTGGRAGRSTVETLVAMGTMGTDPTSGANDNLVFANT
jgi:hypothetical protein